MILVTLFPMRSFSKMVTLDGDVVRKAQKKSVEFQQSPVMTGL
jgi:hypothetical protein